MSCSFIHDRESDLRRCLGLERFSRPDMARWKAQNAVQLLTAVVNIYILNDDVNEGRYITILFVVTADADGSCPFHPSPENTMYPASLYPGP
jgi:hypothetical protein